ncbi:MAG TPA: DNA-binding protein [Micavibrio sp.]|nr:DNA-binding protein [Micavibrio sp.]
MKFWKPNKLDGGAQCPVPLTMTEYITAKEAAAYLRISVRTLERWRAQKLSPPYQKVNGKILYSTHTLKEWIDRH